MKEFQVDNFNKLHEILSPYRKDNRWLFRGHSNSAWQLKPKVGREHFAGCDDERFFRAWKRRAVEFISLPHENDWAWLAVAQHHGLATRLLDWTFNPLAAAFFAVSEKADFEAVVFAFKCSTLIKTEDIKPFDFEGVAKFKPMGVAPRIIRQGGLFTIHDKPENSLEEIMSDADELQKIVIDSTYRNELLFELSHYGINRATLFPDLDGLSAHINWAVANKQYWGEPVEIEEK